MPVRTSAWRHVAGATVAVSLLATGCGSVVDALAGRDAGPEVAKVVVLAPDDDVVADSVLAAVNLALAEIDVGDWDVVVERRHDGTGTGDELAAAADIADEIASDRDVIAVVGGLTPEAIRGAQRPLDEGGIAFVSPADDNPANTRGADPTAPQRPYQSYFRTAIPDGDPLETAADYAVNGLGATTVVAVHEGDAARAARLARFATALGAEARLTSVDALADAVSGIEPDGPVAFYLIDSDVADAVAAVVARLTPESVMIGGEPLTSATLDDLMTGVVAIVPASLSMQHNASVPGLAGSGPVPAAAYDAGRAVAQMLERCLPAARGSARDARHGCLSEMDTVSVTGATGHISFDQYGDRPGSWPTVLVHTADGWVDDASR